MNNEIEKLVAKAREEAELEGRWYTFRTHVTYLIDAFEGLYPELLDDYLRECATRPEFDKWLRDYSYSSVRAVQQPAFLAAIGRLPLVNGELRPGVRDVLRDTLHAHPTEHKSAFMAALRACEIIGPATHPMLREVDLGYWPWLAEHVRCVLGAST